MKFLLDAMKDLKESLVKINSGLLILYGNPEEIFTKLLNPNVSLYFELDTEPYALERDRKIVNIGES